MECAACSGSEFPILCEAPQIQRALRLRLKGLLPKKGRREAAGGGGGVYQSRGRSESGVGGRLLAIAEFIIPGECEAGQGGHDGSYPSPVPFRGDLISPRRSY